MENVGSACMQVCTYEYMHLRYLSVTALIHWFLQICLIPEKKQQAVQMLK